ncbi:hypothetical protein D3C80_1431140 [compost metagenome]
MLNKCADLLVLGNLLCSQALFCFGEGSQVQLITEVAAHGHIAADRKRGCPLYLMVRYRRYVCAHAAGRVHNAGAVLNRETLDCIGVVAGPGLRHVEQHARIEPAAAAGAALEQDFREARGQALHQIIETEHVAVGGFLLPLRSCRSRDNLGHVAVHIPLDIRNRCAGENCAQGFIQVFADLRT